MDFCRRAAHSMNLPCTGTIRLPVHIKRWTVLKSPFVHKAAMEVFERRTHKRLLQIYDADLEVAKKWIEYIETNIPGGIGMKSRIFEYESLDFLDSFKVSQGEIENGTQIKATSSPDAHQVKAMADLVVKKLSENPKLSIDKVTKDVIEQFRSTPKK
ncbi:37S ribosomal protein S10, mitochondrial [Zancudomyces culisetae]|uniref:37S ribosomal protein S10, mitochondrial n=1 Tax=Zancudomyces culisetae TaxID=1213189 RepID=A0A1R1PGC4_ZANCU|nr:37S ribosomal protein S10, mitochondrial [Zancudomyces culisetae]|eukprot:OMH80026.1 37S ribosomal protein S10, mitochondrial [Zancudomyces culisetae]